MAIIGEDGNVYTIIKSIGILNSHCQHHTVYEASVSPLPSNLRVPRSFNAEKVVLKVVKLKDKKVYELAKSQVKSSLLFGAVPRNFSDYIVRHNNAFMGYMGKTEFYCISLPYDEQILSLRSVLNVKYPRGMPLHKISFVVKCVLEGLKSLHEAGEKHQELTAGSVFYVIGERVVKLGFGATSYQPIGIYDDDEEDASCPLFKLPIWGRAPQIVGENFVNPGAVDIWALGVLMLELLRGVKFHRFQNRGDLLEVAARIWDLKYTSGLSGEFVSFVKMCFIEDPSARPSPDVLLRHQFVDKAPKHLQII